MPDCESSIRAPVQAGPHAFVLVAAFTLCGCGPTSLAPPSPATVTSPASVSSTAPQADLAASRHWDHNLLQLMPEIDACIAKSPVTRQVNYAGEQGNSVLVRLQGDETTLDCRVRGNDVQVAPADASLRVEDDGDALFIRGPGENPGGDCYTAPEVRDAHGALLGWMIDPEGC